MFDIRIDGTVQTEELRRHAEEYSREFGLGKITPIRAAFFGVSLAPGQPMTTHTQDEGVIGLRVEDEPATRIVQFRSNGFTFSLTGPYDDWASFRDKALTPARRYLTSRGIERITRVALRYINVIRFGEARIELEDYLPGAPNVPAGLPQTIAGFFSRIVLPIPEDDLVAIVTQALEDPPQPTPSVILDIDVFRQIAVPPSDTSWEGAFEKIREWKNRIFFEFVNEKTVSLYK